MFFLHINYTIDHSRGLFFSFKVAGSFYNAPSEIISDREICLLLGGRYKSILLVGCGGCMNESLAYKNHCPISKYNPSKQILEPIALLSELIHITQMLNDKGYHARYVYIQDGFGIGCMTNVRKCLPREFIEPKPDIVLVMSCPAGCAGVKPHYLDIPVKIITRQKGLIKYCYEEMTDGSKKMIEDSVQILHFSSD